MKNTNKIINDKIRAIICAAIICGLTAGFAFLRTNPATVSAQTAENEIVASPDSSVLTYLNPTTITINDNTPASPYPSTISVGGVNPGIVTQVRVQLNGFSHTYPDDVDIILVGPQGQRSILMSDAGGNPDAVNLNLVFDQNSANILSDVGPLASGTYRPANYVNEANNDPVDIFPAPGPGALTNAPADLSVFNLTNPNDTWSLYVVDDATGDTGTISGGWSLLLTVPTVFTVNSTNDPGSGVCDATECTLREAITAANAANGGDLINFSSAFNTTQTINLLTALPDINKSVTIQGTGANLLTVRRDFNAATDFRIFNIEGGVPNGVAISGMTIAGGRATGGFGGGILSLSNLTLTNVHVTGNQAGFTGGGVSLTGAEGVFTGCTFSGNTASQGGGINYQGDGHTLRLVNTTVSGNSATNNSGGGIENISTNGNSRLEVVSSTIANNKATGFGGGIDTFTQNGAGSTATTTLRNTIIAGNTPNNLTTGTDGGGAPTFQTLGFNLSNDFNGVFAPAATDITATPHLAPLALYGGQTPTHALLAGSPAIDAGDSSGATTDQRGRTRPYDFGFINNVSDGADIGAAEMQIFLVTNTSNTGAGSLRDAVTNAPSNSDILFAVPLFNSPQTITLTTSELVINKNLNIIGTGANLLTVSGNNNSRVFYINSGFTVSLSGMTITGGNGAGAISSGSGGGIFNNGTLNVSNAAVSGNTASKFGGGIYNNNVTLTVNNSTISGNTANTGFGTGGGIDSGGNLTVTNSTISGNLTPNGNNNGGGILSFSGLASITSSTVTNNTAAGANSASGVYRDNGILTIRNTIVAGNVGNAAQPDVVANGGTGITSNGFNLIGNRSAVTFNQTGDQFGTGASPLNPLLGALANNGGTTQTHALLFGSPALDKGQSSGSNTDQRGSPRPVDLPAVTNANGSDGADIGAFEAQTAPTAARTRFDFDGDGKADFSVFRPSSGAWYLLNSQTGFTGVTFGISTDKITPADYDGDGKTDIAVYRDGTWYLLRSQLGFTGVAFGAATDIPMPADYDGDGKAEIAVFRPSNGGWYLYNLATNQTSSTAFGQAGDVPVAADYDGDNKTDIAVFRPSSGSWFLQRSQLGFTGIAFGQNGDKPVPADYDGDGKADVAVFRAGTWYLLRSTLGFTGVAFGAATDIPAAADYDGDGKADVAVFRPSDGTWYLQRSQLGFTGIAFGTNGDKPAPSAFVP